MRKYREYSDEDVIRFAKEVTSVAQLLSKLNLKQAGGNFASIKRILQRLNVDCSHWTGQAWNKGQRLKDWSEYARSNGFRKHFMKERDHCCERCLLKEWQNEKIPLEIEHKDGDRTNNNLENLSLLCCNCHALTTTWRGRKNKKTI